MPTGGLMQLVSYGSEDLYLTGNPQVTLFKVVYQRHTNFAYEWIPQYFDTLIDLSPLSSTKMTVPIKRDGDLLRDLVYCIDLPDIYSSYTDNFKWVKNIGQVMINYVDLVIAGQRISRLYGQWLNIWSELSIDSSHRPGYNELIGNTDDLYEPPVYTDQYNSSNYPAIKKKQLRVPLSFWFVQNPGLALPLISMQYVDLRLDFEFRPLNELFTVGIPSVSPSTLFYLPFLEIQTNHQSLRNEYIQSNYTASNLINKFIRGSWNQNSYVDAKYVYIDQDERRLFASSTTEYLMTHHERLTYSGLSGSNNQVDLNFFHPVKEMVWVYQRDDVNLRNQWTNYTTLLNDKDMSQFLKYKTNYETALLFGLQPSSLLTVMLESGLLVGDFLTYINTTDVNNNSREISNYDEYYNIFYNGSFLFNNMLRQEVKANNYYAYNEPYTAHTTGPGKNKQIYVYSFADKPELLQPTGSANFSRLTNTQFQFNLKTPPPLNNEQNLFILYFYVKQINILRIIGGIAQLVFAN